MVERARARWEDNPKHPSPRATRSTGQAPEPARAGGGAGGVYRNVGRDAGTTADAEAVLSQDPAVSLPYRCRALDCNTQGEDVVYMAAASPCTATYVCLFCVSDLPRVHVCGPFCVSEGLARVRA